MPAADTPGQMIRVKEDGMAEVLMVCLEAEDGSLHWEPLATGREG
jgi:hypothetical protein